MTNIQRVWHYDFSYVASPMPTANYEGSQIEYPMLRQQDASLPGGWYGETTGNMWFDHNHIWLLHNMCVLRCGGTNGIPMNLNMIGGEFRAKVRLKNMLLSRYAQLLLLYQTYDSTISKGVNYVQIEDSISRQCGVKSPPFRILDAYFPSPGVTGPWTDIKVSFPNNELSWACMGAAPDKIQYGCSPTIGQALSELDTNLQIVCHFYQPGQQILIANPTTGAPIAFHITNMELFVDLDINPNATIV